MNLIEESYIEKQQRPKKIKKMILIIITILLFAIIVIISLLFALKEKPLTAKINGKVNNDVLKILKRQENGIYIPIKQFANYVGYESFNGKYEAKSEDNSKCYVKSSYEAVNLSLNNERIYQLDLSTNELEDYRYYDMKEKVVSIDGELCIKSDELPQVFNTRLTYNEQEKQIVIETLPYLVQQKNTEVLNYGYEAIDENFSNQKAIFSDMLIVTKNDKKIAGIIDADTGETLVEAKYSSIKYLPNIGDCIVEDNKKFGVVSPKETKKTKIQVNYDSIDLVDKDAGLYVVGKEGRYGVVDLNGNQIVPVDYEQIGIDKSNFKANKIDNKYLLINSLIPVKKDGLWGMLNKKGNVIVQPVFDSYGYITTTSGKNAESLLVVPDYEVIVVCKNKKYGLMNKTGDKILDVVADDIYMTDENGEYKYWINANNILRDLTLYLDQVSGINVQTPNQSQEQQPQQQEEQPQQEQQMQEQQMQEQQMQEQQMQEQQMQEQQPQQQEQQMQSQEQPMQQ